jgi:hypothetical protein
MIHSSHKAASEKLVNEVPPCILTHVLRLDQSSIDKGSSFLPMGHQPSLVHFPEHSRDSGIGQFPLRLDGCVNLGNGCRAFLPEFFENP